MFRAPRRISRYTLCVRRSTSGLGLFAAEEIPRRTFVIEYCGDVVTEDEGNRRGGKYLFDLENGKMIDGTTRKNTARYINHSCKPNCEIDYVGNRVHISTTRRVTAGEELTYDYGKEYYTAFIKPHGCRCGHHRTKRKATSS